MSIKQMAWTVGNGSRVDIWFERGPTISGYVAGMDDYNWLIITPDLEKHLVHKARPSNIRMHSESTLCDEEQFQGLEAVLAPFRQKLIDRHLIPDRLPRGVIK